MINSLAKRIVIIAHYPKFLSEWRFFDDESNSKMDWKSFTGIRGEGDLIRGHIPYVVDWSEYVVRFGYRHGFRKSALSPDVSNPDGLPKELSYGRKADILGKKEGSFSRYIETDNYSSKFTNSTPFRQLTSFDINVASLFGVKSPASKTCSTSVNINNDIDSMVENGSMCLNYNISPQLYQDYFNFTLTMQGLHGVKEVWVDFMGFLYGLNTNSGRDLYKTLKEIIGRSVEFFDLIESVFGLKVKHLTIDQYMELVEKVSSEHISYDILTEMIGHKLWGKQFLSDEECLRPDGSVDNGSYCKKLSKSEYIINNKRGSQNNLGIKPYTIFKSQKNMCINMGLQAIEITLNDSRFDDYDIYIAGFFGINEHFRCSPWFDNLSEYFLLSKYLKEGKVKYLPERVIELSSESANIVRNTGMNLQYERKSA